MSSPVYMDVHVSASITAGLRRRGIDVLSFLGVIYAHQLSAGIGRLVEDLELALVCCELDELANRVT
jgi:hypothetical protein